MEIEDVFRAHERMLWGLSYRLTGCAADADDIVQETFVRALQHGSAAKDEPWRPWLVRVATNLGLDLLRRRKRRAYKGPWLPSPIESTDSEPPLDGRRADAAGRYELLESVSFAFLLALEALTPRQRAVLLLRDVFDYSARETGGVLEMSEENVRITHHRARRAMRDYDGERCVPTRALQDQTRQALEAFVRCLINQDVAGVEALLVESVRTVTDGGGEYTALAAPMVGRGRVAVLYLRTALNRASNARLQLRTVNGLPALLIEFSSARARQAPRLVLRCDVARDGRIREIHSILASGKLSALRFESETTP